MLVTALAISSLSQPAGQQAHAQSVSNEKLIVYCLDEKRNSVFRVKAGQCNGRVIDEDEANRIKDARAARLRSIVTRKDESPYPKLNRRSIGTGFFISHSGYMMTNDHVISGCNGVSVETPSGNTWKANVVSTLPTYDLALIKVNEQPPGVAEFNASSFVELQERADLVGYPTQGLAPRLPIFTEAVRSQHFGIPGDNKRFQIKGDVRFGNSGGPVLDSSGLVIGVIFAELNSVSIYKRTGRVPDDTGIAVTNEVVFSFLERNGVQPNIVSEKRESMPREAVFAKSRDIVARIGCWK